MSKYGTVSPDELNTPIMQKLRDLCGLTDPSVEQNIILTRILNHKFKRKEVAFYFWYQFKESISQEAIATCLFRTAFGLRWEKGMSGGNTGYLSGADLETLATTVRERARVDKAFDKNAIIEEAFSLKKKRRQPIAFETLSLLRAPKYQ